MVKKEIAKTGIIETLNNFKVLVWFSGFLIAGTLTVYGFFMNNKRQVTQAVKEGIAPVYARDSIILDWMARKDAEDALRWKSQELRDQAIIEYVNNPALTKKIEEQTIIIKTLMDEIKKNEFQTRLNMPEKGAS